MIYFDNSATTLKKPQAVYDEVYRGLSSEKFGNAGRASHSLSTNSLSELFKTRSSLAKIFNVKNPLDIALCQNASAALNFTIKSLFSEDDHIITTEMEHNSVLRPLYQLEKNGGELSIIKFNSEIGEIEYAKIEESIKKNTKAIIVNHCSNVLGSICDIDFIYDLCKKYNLILIIDASQTAGTIPIDFSKYKNSILCFTGHKGLYGPQGTGGILINGKFNFKNVFAGGSGSHSFDYEHPKSFPDIFEVGTMNVPAFMGLKAGCDYILDYGVEQVNEKLAMLRTAFISECKKIPNLKIYGDYESAKKSAIVGINIAERFAGEVSQILDEDFDIITRAGAHCAPLMHKRLGTTEQGIVRFSFSSFNTMEEIQQAISALQNIAK